MAKRAITVAAAGGHNLLMLGPPGSGKTMLAKRMPTILPDLTPANRSRRRGSTARSAACKPGQPLLAVRPFRSPHHTISDAGLVGGGSTPSPGEISLAHNGVLFLDELPEFNRRTLEVLRQPLEDGTVTISPGPEQHDVSGQFHADRRVESVPLRLSRRSAAKLPLHAAADRAVHEQDQRARCWTASTSTSKCPPVPFRELSGGDAGHVAARRCATRWRRPGSVRRARFDGSRTRYNADMTHRQTRQFCELDDECQNLLEGAR